jgi:hypothetical protein
LFQHNDGGGIARSKGAYGEACTAKDFEYGFAEEEKVRVE